MQARITVQMEEVPQQAADITAPHFFNSTSRMSSLFRRKTGRTGRSQAWLLRASIALLPLSIPALAADQITVDVARTIRDTSNHPIGINLDYLQDDDHNRAAIRSTPAALKDMGVKFLRYPGGEKSDAYLWSVPPYERSTPTLARTGTNEWPSYDRSLVFPDGKTFRIDPLDFDEFMSMCRSINCEPVVVVAYDSMYKPAGADGVAPTRQQLLETAREWVRYANVTKGYRVKYWEIGNESYKDSYNGSTTADNYANDLIEFSRVMKSVDPTIFVGANGEGASWWYTILSKASASIDFLSVHSYPVDGWGSYDTYRLNNWNLTFSADSAIYAVQNYAPIQDRSRLRVAITELNVIDWSGDNPWRNSNDIGHAIALVDIIGQHIKNPQIEFVQLWNTRWVLNNYKNPPDLFDALSPSGEFFPIGWANAIWGQYLLNQLVATTDTPMVRSFASYSPSLSRSNVVLINKDTSPRNVSVAFSGLGPISSVVRRIFHGTGPEDLRPVWSQAPSTFTSGNSAEFTMDPVSVTVLSVEAAGNRPPTAISASPSFGTGSSAFLVFTYSDPNGFGDLAFTYSLISTAVDSRNACYVIYNRASNGLYLVSDDGQTDVGSITPGSAGAVQNTQCILNGTGSSVFGAGSNLTITMALTFKAGFTGMKNIYMTAADTAGLFADWTSKGFWDPATSFYRLPTTILASPSPGTGEAHR